MMPQKMKADVNESWGTPSTCQLHRQWVFLKVKEGSFMNPRGLCFKDVTSSNPAKGLFRCLGSFEFSQGQSPLFR